MNYDQKKQTFNKLFECKGGISTMDLDELRDSLLKQFKRHTNIDIYLDFINNSEVNAVVAKFEGSYYIGINEGCLPVFNFLARKIAANPDILSEFGESGGENNRSKVQYLLNIYPVEGEVKEEPLTQTRRYLALAIYTQLILNVAFHELGHILNGHIDLISSAKVNFLEERQSDDDKVTRLQSYDHQTLEIDADAFSAIETLRELREMQSSPDEPYQELFPDDKKLIKLWSFIRTLGWRLMEVNVKPENLLSIKHPPTNIRFDFSRVAGYENYKYLGFDIEHFNENYYTGAEEVNTAIRMLSITDPLPISLNFEKNPQEMTHASFIFFHWDEIREKLKKHATIGLRDANILDTPAAQPLIEAYNNMKSLFKSDNRIWQ